MPNRRDFLGYVALGSAASPAAAAPAAAAPGETAGTAVFNVRQFGASGREQQSQTDALQSAIDACGRNGGGTVLFPNGVYLTGTLVLRDNVTLHLAAGATLLGSPNVDHYLNAGAVGGSAEFRLSILYAGKTRNIAIEGNGTIDGQGAAFDRKKERPRLIYFEDSSRVSVTGVTLRNAAEWVSHYMRCDDLTIRGIRIDSFANYNNDGIDVDGCQGVFISDCHIACSDDALCLKSEVERPCRNVTVTDCVIRSRWGAIKFGTPGLGGFENIVISNCAIYDTYGCALKLELVDGGRLENVVISNLTMDNVTGPFFVRLGARNKAFHTGKKEFAPGTLRNVLVSNVRARLSREVRRSLDGKGEIADAEETHLGSIITGLPGCPVENVVFENIHVSCPGGGNREEAHHRPPELPQDYPEYTMFGPSPAYGFYIHHARNISLRNVTLECDQPDLRPAVLCDDVEELDLAGLKAPGVTEAESIVVLRDTRDAFVQGCRVLGPVGSFLSVEGRSRDILLAANDLRRASHRWLLKDGLTEGTVRES